MLDGVANTVVSVMESEKAYALRQKVKDGEAAPEDLKALSQEAYMRIIQMLDVQVRADLDSCRQILRRISGTKLKRCCPG